MAYPDDTDECTCCLPRRAFLRNAARAGTVGFVATGFTAPARAAPVETAPDRPRYAGTVIDCHGHYTNEPPAMLDWRRRQIAAITDPAHAPSPSDLKIGDDEIRASLVNLNIKLQGERGITKTLFSPRAGGMGHHIGDARTSLDWSIVSNDMIHRIATLFPDHFVGVCQLPQTPGVSPKNCTAELERCVSTLGFVGCNVNPDPTGGFWRDPPLSDRYWYPLWEKMVELDVPGMVHVSTSINRNFETLGPHYLNGDTTAFMQLMSSDLFKDFPTLRFVIPHGGGAVPYHWARFRGLAQDAKRPPITELLRNVFFDTCVYHQPGIDLLLKVVPHDNILFASEMVGAIKGIDPETGHGYDDTKGFVDAAALSPSSAAKIFHDNVRRVYPRLRL